LSSIQCGFGEEFSVEGRFVIFLGDKVKTKDRTIGGRIAKIVTNISFLDERLV
jgi:hypothetical protein